MPAKPSLRYNAVPFRLTPGSTPHLKFIDAVLRDNELYIIPGINKVILRCYPHGIERCPGREHPSLPRLIGRCGKGINAPPTEGHIFSRIRACRDCGGFALGISIVVITEIGKTFFLPTLCKGAAIGHQPYDHLLFKDSI